MPTIFDGKCPTDLLVAMSLKSGTVPTAMASPSAVRSAPTRRNGNVGLIAALVLRCSVKLSATCRCPGARAAIGAVYTGGVLHGPDPLTPQFCSAAAPHRDGLRHKPFKLPLVRVTVSRTGCCR